MVVEHICRLESAASVIIGAPTGVSARLVHGNTLHSIFSLPIEKGHPGPFRQLTGARLQQERLKWRSINWLIIDEVSMVSYRNLRNIHLHLQEFKQNEDLSGGVNVLLFGDILQLPPVTVYGKQEYCFVQPTEFQHEVHLWQSCSFCELLTNMRQQGDTDFIDLLNSVRVGKVTMKHIQILNDHQYLEDTDTFKDAVRIFPTKDLVNKFNSKMTAELKKTTVVYTINSVDTSL